MATKQPAKSSDGKPTIDQQNHDQNVGQRERSHAGGKGGKPTITPETHDRNYGQRDTIDEEEETEGTEAAYEPRIAENSTLTDEREVE